MALTIIDGFAGTEVIKTSWAGVHDTTGIDYLHTQAALAFSKGLVSDTSYIQLISP